ncbi:MAG: hypothetical protein NPIRA06_31150 [Nitrospirales bacterium]|nr:MAG: hypothetical protein NPIRA06_31150 [Nitrospirales bacterium]
MPSESKRPVRRSPVWMWISADGGRWRINHTPNGVWSCQIGLGGKRVGSWKTGLPPSLDSWPKGTNQE